MSEDQKGGLEPDQHLLAYIAHSKKHYKDALELQREMTSRGFPTIRSEQVDDVYNAPAELSTNRVHILENWRNRFFFFFIDVSNEDPIALIELGYALSKTEHVCAIGKVRTNSFLHHPRITLYDSVNNFLARHFPPSN